MTHNCLMESARLCRAYLEGIIMMIRGIRESVDSLYRDDADMPMPPYIRKAYNRPNAAFVSLFR